MSGHTLNSQAYGLPDFHFGMDNYPRNDYAVYRYCIATYL